MSFLEQAKAGLGKAGGFIFGAGTETPTYESLKKRREVAELLAQQAVGSTPQNFGEGIASVGRALAYKLMDKRLAPQEAEMGEQSRSRLMEIAGLLGGGGGAVGGYSGTPPSVSAKNDPTAPAPASNTAPGGFTLPQGAGNFQELFPQVEQQYRLPEGYLSRVAQIESGGNPNAKNPNSSATGLFQFVKSTADQYGVNPTDPVSSTVGAGKLAADNAAVLTQALGRPPTAGELYLAHQQGAGGAVKLLTNPDAPAASIVGADAVNLNGGNPNMSARDFAGLWMGKIDGSSGISPSPFGGGGIGFDPALMSELADLAGNEYLKPGERMVAQALIQRMMDQPEGITPYQQAQLGFENDRLALDRARFEREGQPKPTDDMREYDFAKSQGYTGTFQEFMLTQKRAGAPSVTTNIGPNEQADAAFLQKLDAAEGDTFSELLKSGPTVQQNAGNIGILEQQLANTPQGAQGAWVQFAGSLGLPVEGVSDVQAAQATINALVPEQRTPGSGPMSDADLALFKQSLPQIINQPGGNQLIIARMKAINAYQAEMAKIANAVVARRMKREDARAAMAALPNPLEGYKAEIAKLGQAPAGEAQGAPVKVNSMGEFNTLPSGTRFIAPDGSLRIKP